MPGTGDLRLGVLADETGAGGRLRLRHHFGVLGPFSGYGFAEGGAAYRYGPGDWQWWAAGGLGVSW